MPPIVRIASRCFWPKAPAPARTTFTFLSRAFARSAVTILEYDVTDCGVRSRHMIEAVDFLDIAVEGAAHNQPHDEFNPFGSGLAHVADTRNIRETLGILEQA